MPPCPYPAMPTMDVLIPLVTSPSPSKSPMRSSRATLRRPREVAAVFATRRTHGGRCCVVHVRVRGDAAPTRWTVAAGRRLGNAVQRNRVKRRLRAALAQTMTGQGLDIVVVARPSALSEQHDALTAEVASLVARAQRRATDGPGTSASRTRR